MISTKIDVSFFLSEIAAKASNLSERCNSSYSLDLDLPLNHNKIDSRIKNWAELVCGGDSGKLKKRWQFNNWTVDQVKYALNDNISWNHSCSLPSWATIIEDFIALLPTFKSSDLFSFICKPDEPLPFEDALLPFISVARKKLAGYRSHHVTDSAYIQMEWALLQRLSTICFDTLIEEFDKVRPPGVMLYSLLVGSDPHSNTTIYYKKFIYLLIKERHWLNVIKTYPVLARLIATAVEYWVEATKEFFNRLNSDYSSLQDLFFSKTPKQKVCKIDAANLSDPHNRGRSVIILELEDGTRIVYKPKDLRISLAYQQFLAACNASGMLLSFKISIILACDGYGWEEFIDYLPCPNETAAKCFYERAGMLLCILYVFGSNDCHNENLIAHNEHLCLIDTETLISPKITGEIDEFFWDSVMRTAMLPFWFSCMNGVDSYDVSGLGCPDQEQGKPYEKRCIQINTDEMHLALILFEGLKQKNIPTLNTIDLAARDYLPELLNGFQKMYHFICDNSHVLTHFIQTIQTNNYTIRFMYRNTRNYFYILRNSFNPKNLKNGIDRSIQLEMLSRVFLNFPEQTKNISLLGAELASLEQMDIPYFYTFPREKKLFAHDGVLSNSSVLEETALEQLQNRLVKLNEIDLAQQLRWIESSIHMQIHRPHDVRSIAQNNTITETNPHTMEEDELLANVTKIALEIKENAIIDKHGHFRWVGPSYNPLTDRLQLQPLGYNLYDGHSGIALLFSALYATYKHEKYKTWAIETLKPLLQIVNNDPIQQFQFCQKYGIGGFTGLASIVYALTHISQFLNQSELLNAAIQLAKWITPELIKNDNQLDIIGGSAGACLALLILYEYTGEETILGKANLCGKHLLACRMKVNSGYAWKTIAKQPLTGFSHGAAGIAFSLLKLYSVTKNIKYLNAAKSAIAFEQSLFSLEHKNWPDLREKNENDRSRFGTSWCHGATGIGMARLAGSSILNNTLIQQEIDAALDSTLDMLGHGLDHLCCGNFGRLEYLNILKQHKPNTLQDTVKATASLLTSKANKKGHYQLSSLDMKPIYHPGFLQGNAGIAYQLLRLSKPQLPCVLLLE